MNLNHCDTFIFPPEIHKKISFPYALIKKSDYLNALSQRFPVFEEWLKKNHHGDMEFLEKNFEARQNLDLIFPGTETIFVGLFPYHRGHRVRGHQENAQTKIKTDRSQPEVKKNSLMGQKLISKYVYGKDYHKVIPKIIAQIFNKLKENIYHNLSWRTVVDTAPFFDRLAAEISGLGFQGKNTMIIRPGMGSFFFIGSALLNLTSNELGGTPVMKNPIKNLDCGECQRCLEGCPTQALVSPFDLDSNRCLSYLTIEKRGDVAKEFHPFFRDTVYGCDICQDVCPYNFVSSDFKLLREFESFHDPFTQITAEDILQMTQMEYEQWFGGTAATRAKKEGLQRNAKLSLETAKSKWSEK